MSRIIITLTKEEIGNLLLGGEVSVPLHVTTYDNLQSVAIRSDEYSEQVREEE